jgi:hypothetical protein
MIVSIPCADSKLALNLDLSNMQINYNGMGQNIGLNCVDWEATCQFFAPKVCRLAAAFGLIFWGPVLHLFLQKEKKNEVIIMA